MATERVVSFRDDKGQSRKLDINNGYVYDQKGNQVAKWSPKESTREGELQKMCADYAYNEQRRLMRLAYEAPHRNMADLSNALEAARSGQNVEAVIRRASDASSQLEDRQVNMDLGTADVHLPAALPNFAGGYRQFAPVADMASPPLLVPKPADKYFIFSQNDAYQVALPTVGAPAGQPQEVPPRLANQTFTTVEFALGGFVPAQIDAAADAPLRIRQATLKRVLNVLMLRRELRVANLLTNSSNWNSNNTVTLGAGFQWDGGASSDPIKDIHARMEASLGDCTGIIMPEPLWHAFQRNPAVQKYFTYKNGAQALPDAQQMQSILNIPPIYVAKMKYFNPNGSALTYAWGTSAVLIRQPDQMPPTTQDDIATSYSFRWNATNVPDGGGKLDPVAGMAFASSGGFVVREFFNQLRGTMGGSQLVCLHHDYEAMTSGFVGGLIAGAYQ